MGVLRDELGWDEAELGTVFSAIDCHGHVSREQVGGGACCVCLRGSVHVLVTPCDVQRNRVTQLLRTQRTHQFGDIMVAEELRDPSADAELLRHLSHARPNWWTDMPNAVASL